MELFGHKHARQLAKPLALTLALISLVFLLQVVPHGHAKGQNEAACRICQAAHVSATPAVSGITLSVPLVAIGEIAEVTFGSATETFLRHSDPRAPPAVVLL